MAISIHGRRELMIGSNDELAERLRGLGCYRSIFFKNDLNPRRICPLGISSSAKIECRVNPDPGTHFTKSVYVRDAPIFNARHGSRTDSNFACGGANTHAAAFALKHLAKDFRGHRLAGHGAPHVKKVLQTRNESGNRFCRETLRLNHAWGVPSRAPLGRTEDGQRSN